MADSRQEKEKKLNSMSDAVKEVIDCYPIGHEFHGNELKTDVVSIYPKAINMYPDTILRMARRHRRDSFEVADQNNSLYRRVKSLLELLIEDQLKREEALAKQPEHIPERQGELFPYQGFLAVFFAFFFGVVFAVGSFFGRPMTPSFFMASRSASLYKPVGPKYINGLMPLFWSRLFTPSAEMPKIWDICSAVIPSIRNSLHQKSIPDQEKNGNSIPTMGHFVGQNDTAIWVKMTHFRNTRTLKNPKKNTIFGEFSKNLAINLDRPLRRGYF